jgi:hypothetical protein
MFIVSKEIILVTYFQLTRSNPDLPNTIGDTREPIADDRTKHCVFREASERLLESHSMTRRNLIVGRSDALTKSSDADDLQRKLLIM